MAQDREYLTFDAIEKHFKISKSDLKNKISLAVSDPLRFSIFELGFKKTGTINEVIIPTEDTLRFKKMFVRGTFDDDNGRYFEFYIFSFRMANLLLPSALSNLTDSKRAFLYYPDYENRIFSRKFKSMYTFDAKTPDIYDSTIENEMEGITVPQNLVQRTTTMKSPTDNVLRLKFGTPLKLNDINSNGVPKNNDIIVPKHHDTLGGYRRRKSKKSFRKKNRKSSRRR